MQGDGGEGAAEAGEGRGAGDAAGSGSAAGPDTGIRQRQSTRRTSEGLGGERPAKRSRVEGDNGELFEGVSGALAGSVGNAGGLEAGSRGRGGDVAAATAGLAVDTTGAGGAEGLVMPMGVGVEQGDSPDKSAGRRRRRRAGHRRGKRRGEKSKWEQTRAAHAAAATAHMDADGVKVLPHDRLGRIKAGVRVQDYRPQAPRNTTNFLIGEHGKTEVNKALAFPEDGSVASEVFSEMHVHLSDLEDDEEDEDTTTAEQPLFAINETAGGTGATKDETKAGSSDSDGSAAAAAAAAVVTSAPAASPLAGQAPALVAIKSPSTGETEAPLPPPGRVRRMSSADSQFADAIISQYGELPRDALLEAIVALEREKESLLARAVGAETELEILQASRDRRNQRTNEPEARRPGRGRPRRRRRQSMDGGRT